MQKPLLAKSLKYGELTLEQHLSDTEVAAKVIFKGRILKNWCRFFKVKDASQFLTHLRMAALFHDIGKANADFDQAVRGNQNQQQALRHEWLSALILHLPNVRQWLNPSGLDLEIITAAVLSHHLKAHPQHWGKPRTSIDVGDRIELFLTHSEVIHTLEKVANLAKIKGLPELPNQWIAGDRFWEQVYEDTKNTAFDFELEIEEDLERRSLLLAVKAGLIAADSVASGIFRVKSSEEIEQWVEEILHQSDPITPEEIETKILQPRYRQISQESGKPFQLKPFQENALTLGDRVLLLSGCGTGKTLFAYKWQQAIVKRYSMSYLIFLYPTRGTATEGFKDYVSWAPESDASLLTGTARYELQEMRDNPKESDKDFTTDERLFALGFWGKRFFSATVDQFLSFLTHSYGGLCLLPVLTNSVVVIDEVHSFSRGMFDHLISFLENFDIPVLCMTATLPQARKQELEKQGLQIFSSVDDQELEIEENRPRYWIHANFKETYENSLAIAYQQVQESYAQQNCILWVVNTVDRCREIGAKLEKEFGLEALIYHSRFKLLDRKKRHEETVKAFKFTTEKRKPVIAITTQVCEMSLNLDADILITELAPISSLVQRFGRSNRSSDRPKNFRSQIFVYEPSDPKPYQKHELEAARKFIADVGGEVSPGNLAEKLLKYSPSERLADGDSYFVNSGYYAEARSFRGDENDYSVNAILNRDLEEIEAVIAEKGSLDPYILPIPKKYQLQDKPKWMPRYLALADSCFYCSKRGFGG